MALTTARKIDWPIVYFFLLAYVIAWGVHFLILNIARQSGIDADVLLVAAENLKFESLENKLTVSPWLVYGLTRIQDFSFSIAGLLMIMHVSGVDGLRELGSRLVLWRFDLRVYLVALLPLGLYGFAVLITAMANDNILSGVDLSPQAIKAIFLGAESGLLVYLLTRGPLGEELGLRGFALPRLQMRHSPFKSASIIGCFWALWHLPVLWGRNPVAIVFFLVVAFCLSYIFTWLFNASRGSLIPVLLFHTTQNAEEIWEVVFPNLTSVDWELSSSLLLLIIGFGFGVLLWRQPKQEQLAS